MNTNQYIKRKYKLEDWDHTIEFQEYGIGEPVGYHVYVNDLVVDVHFVLTYDDFDKLLELMELIKKQRTAQRLPTLRNAGRGNRNE